MVRSRSPGAVIRAGVVALVVLMPELILGGGGAPQLVALFALMAAAFTFAEYSARAPSLVEFRDARPYNRLRVAAILAALVLTCSMLRHDWAEASFARPIRWLAAQWAKVLDLPWSPVHLLLHGLPPEVNGPVHDAVFAAAAAAYGLSLLMVATFALVVRLRGWPLRSAFNVWVNLPQFDPTAGDVVERLRQNALINVALGLLLPLLAPMVGNLLAGPFDGAMLSDPAALVWLVIGWAFIPASLAMRGLALHRLAVLIAAHRDRVRRRDGIARTA